MGVVVIYACAIGDIIVIIHVLILSWYLAVYGVPVIIYYTRRGDARVISIGGEFGRVRGGGREPRVVGNDNRTVRRRRREVVVRDTMVSPAAAGRRNRLLFNTDGKPRGDGV